MQRRTRREVVGRVVTAVGCAVVFAAWVTQNWYQREQAALRTDIERNEQTAIVYDRRAMRMG